MNDDSFQPDPAAVLGAAISLWRSVWIQATSIPRLNLSECYNGGDEFMRLLMRIATDFETWSCGHVFFDELDDVWPYILEKEFGEACLSVLGGPEALLDFDARNCLRVALKLRLPVKFKSGFPVPIDVIAPNPLVDAPFLSFRIQTLRRRAEDGCSEFFTLADDPYDEEFDPPYFALFGVVRDGTIEHVANRNIYADLVRLAGRLAPGIVFPVVPCSRFASPYVSGVQP